LDRAHAADQGKERGFGNHLSARVLAPRVNPLAGKPAPASALTDIPRLITAYYTERPDPSIATQRVAFGTSGHRGSSFEVGFNEYHVLAISQAICEFRKARGITGPLFMGFDTHALSAPAFATALEVLAANGIELMIAPNDEYTPTPAVSRAILKFNQGRVSGLADGIVITPSHNPPDSGGFKYNPTNGGPADSDITGWIENRANEILSSGVETVQRICVAEARRAATTHDYDYLGEYVEELGAIVDMPWLRDSGIRMGVDPLGGAGVHYWGRIGERYGLNLTVVNTDVDPTFRFMTLDWDGKIRMDPSSSYAMQRLIGLKDRYDIAFACDTDHDRHGIVTASSGLMPPNHYLSTCIDYLFSHRQKWRTDAAVGKTVVSSAMIDRVAGKLKRRVYEVPVGFKWFADGLVDGTLGFGGEESAGASFSRIDGGVWTTDKDGLAPALLSAEITARTGKDPGQRYQALAGELGTFYADRIDAPANAAQKRTLSKLDRQQIRSTELAGEPIQAIITQAPGNNAPIGGVKVSSLGGWFAARPSGTEDIYKIYAESFHDDAHLRRLISEAQSIVDAALAGS
jgi:phosphoglucomutase